MYRLVERSLNLVRLIKKSEKKLVMFAANREITQFQGKTRDFFVRWEKGE